MDDFETILGISGPFFSGKKARFFDVSGSKFIYMERVRIVVVGLEVVKKPLFKGFCEASTF